MLLKKILAELGSKSINALFAKVETIYHLHYIDINHQEAVSSVFAPLHPIEVVSWPAQKIMHFRKNQPPSQSFENRLKCLSEMVLSDKHNLFQFQFFELSYRDYYQNVCSILSL